MTQDEGMLRYESGHYELNGYPLRPGDAVEIFTDSEWTLGSIAYQLVVNPQLVKT